jgi:hypothetical protein
MNATFWRRRLLFTAFRMTADDTMRDKRFCSLGLLFYVNKIPLLYAASGILRCWNIWEPAILAKAFQGVVINDWVR